MAVREWTLKRNCSMSPRQLTLVYAALCTTSLTIAIVFAVRGAWYVFGYACLELLARGTAFFLYARHANDREHIELMEGCLLVELIQKEQVRQFRLDPRRVRVEPPVESRKLVILESGSMTVEVGRFLTEWKRREFARELQSALASLKRTEFQF
jgi:uncharacterized membrane protein